MFQVGWLVERRTVLVMKDSKKGTEVRNYRPIACLNLIWKLLAGIISGKTYDHLEENKPLPEEQKESRRKCQGTKYQLATDRCILQNCIRMDGLGGLQEGLQYGPLLMIITTMGMVDLPENAISLIKQSMNQWKCNLYADAKLLGSVPIRRGIFLGNHYCL